MSFLWFLVAVIFFILWRVKKPTHHDSAHTNEDYYRGYNEGRREVESRLKAKLAADDISRESLLVLLPQEAHEPAQYQSESASSSPIRHYLDDEEIPDITQDIAQTVPGALPIHQQQKQHNPAQTLNIILYLASFLLVAAAAALIAASMPAAIKLAGLIVVVVLFYGAGIILHYTVTILRPAAIAFVGTGLAILPFVGFALTALTGMPGSSAWAIISLVGLVAYFSAAIILQSHVVSYLTLGFVISLACSVVSLVPVGFVWYFVALVIVSLSASVVGYFKPSWIPKVFTKPIDITGQYITPLALGASLLAFQSMDLKMYEIVFSAATLQYLIQLLQSRSQKYETISRIGVHTTILTYVASSFSGDMTIFGWTWWVLLSFQAVYSLVRVRPEVGKSYITEMVFLLTIALLSIFGLAFWIGNDSASTLSLLNWGLVGAIGVAAAIRFRSAHWAYATVLSLLFIPSILTQSIIQPPVPKEIIALFYVAAAGAVTWGLARYRKSFALAILFYCTIGIWFGTALTYACLSGSTLSVAAVLGIASVIATLLSIITRLPALMIVAGILWPAGIAALLSFLDIPSEWFALILGSGGALSTFGAALVFDNILDRSRRNYLLAVAAGLLATACGSLGYGDTVAAHLTYVLFVLVSLGVLTERSGRSPGFSFVTVLSIVTYATYTVLVWIAGLMLGDWWLIAAYALGALVFWIASYVEKIPWLLPGSYISILAVVSLLFDHFGVAPDSKLLYATWIVTALFATSYTYFVGRRDTIRQWISISAVWAVTLFAALSGLGSDSQSYQYGAALSLTLAGVGAIVHARSIKRQFLMEVGVYVVVTALQWLTAITYPNLSLVLYAYWWAAAIGTVAWFFKDHLEKRLMLSMALLTFVTSGYALTDGGGYSLLFLIQNVAFAGVGAILQKRWVIWWGVIASIIAVIYFLRDYLYLWLALLGLFLIGVVVWRLIVISRRQP